MNTLETLQEILMRDHALSREQVAPTAELASLGIDSLSLVELMFHIEDRFAIQIPGDNPTDLQTVADVAAYVEGLVANPRNSTSKVAIPAPGA